MELGGIMLFVKDMKGVIAFYRDVIGLSTRRGAAVPRTSFFPIQYMLELANCCVSIVPASQTEGRQKLDLSGRKRQCRIHQRHEVEREAITET